MYGLDMSNRNITSVSRRIAFRCPLDLAAELDRRAPPESGRQKDMIVSALRMAWHLPVGKPTCASTSTTEGET